MKNNFNIKGRARSDALFSGLFVFSVLLSGNTVFSQPASVKIDPVEVTTVAIARALANDPVLLLADEPTRNLDEQTAEMVFNYFLDVTRNRKVAALVATHNIELARRMDRIVRVHDHRLIEV